MPPLRLADLGSKLDLPEDADYLRFAEFGFLDAETSLGGFPTPRQLISCVLLVLLVFLDLCR